VTSDGFVLLYGADPTARSDGGSVRARMLHQALEPFGVTTLFPASGGALLPVGSRRKALKQRYAPLPVRRKALLGEMAARLAQLGPRYVLSASHLFTPVALSHAGPDVWVDHFDRWGPFGRREADARRGAARAAVLAQARLWERRERRERARYRIATTASFADAQALSEAVWLPNPVRQVAAGLRPPEGRRAGFLANFAYWPNRDAYSLLVTTWLPVLRRQGWDVVVAGYDAESLDPVDGVRNMGTVEDVADFYGQVDVTLAPVRLGGGMKVKVVESLAHGRPALVTPHAADGLPPSLLPHLVIASDPPADLERAIASLDPGTTEGLRPFQPEQFEEGVRVMAARLMEAAR